jgi:maleylpyruvate isomerase
MDPDVRTELLREADQRLVRTVDGLSEDDLRAPSLLPGWTRGHVVAHLALNGEALAEVLTGLREGESPSLYPSQEARDGDIDALADGDAGELRDRLLGSVTHFLEAALSFPDELGDRQVPRTPGGPTFPASGAVLMRWREVEIHHADLGAGYTAADWSTDVAVAVLDSMRQRPWPTGFRVLARDLADTWEYGDLSATPAPPTVTGESRDLAWWLTGRGDGETLTSDDTDQLPEVPPW